MIRSHTCKFLAACAVAQAAIAVTPVMAQTSEGQSAALEEILVVGTAIRRTPIDEPYAVSVVDREAMEQRGAPLMVDLFKNLGASHGVVGERQGWYNSSQPATILESVSNVNLRGLGASRTLVLVNGRRQTYLPARLIGGRFVDVSVIPAIALGRLEVLKEGASAIYGSDAVGGIANFVTRDDFDGLEAIASYDSYDDAGDAMAGVIWGGSIGDADIVVSAEHERRGELESEDRNWALNPLWDPWRAGWSSVGNPGYFWFPTGIDTAITPRQDVIDGLKAVQWSGKVDPQCNGLNGYPENAAVDPYYCVFNYQPWDNLIEEIRSTRVFGEINGVLENGASYHLEALWSEAVTPNWQTQPSHPPFPLLHRGVMEIGPNHPNRLAFCQDKEYSKGFEAECAGMENWYWRGRPFGNGDPDRFARRETSTWRLAGSLQGEFAAFGGREIGYDAGLSFSSSEGNLNVPGILTERLFLAFRGYGGPNCGVDVAADNTLAPGMKVAATSKAPGTGGCEYYNPFSSASRYSSMPGAPYYGTPNPEYDPAQANSAELAQWLNSVSELNSETQMMVADFTLSGSLFADRAGYAAGYQFRRFSAEGMPNDHGNLRLNPCAALGDRDCLSGNFGAFTFINAHNPYDEDQTVHRLFAEFAIVFNDSLDAQVALNYEKYDEASSVDPKVGLRLRVNDALTLRGSVQTTFRTPSVDDLLEEVPLTVTQNVSQVGAWIPVDIYGDSSLEPEQAFTYNFGLVVLLDSGVEMTLDYWSYDFQDVIGSLPHDTVDDLYADAGTRAGVARYIHCADGRADTLSSPCDSRSITRVEVPLVNWPGVETSGLDWELRGDFDAGPGSLKAGVSGSYTLKYDIKALARNGAAIQARTEAAGKLNFGNPLAVPIPDWKAQAFAAYHWSDYSLSAYLNYISSYEDDGAYDGYGGVPVAGFTVDSFATWDVSFQWRLPDLGLNVTLSALNLTDEDPPFANVEHGYDGFTHNPKGRRLKLILRYGLGGG